MNCSNPQYIPKPGLLDRPSSQSALHYERTLRKDFTVVPCGKCMGCVKARQDNFACRIRAEAEKRGSMCLVTLTYNDDNLPLVSTVWSVSKETGEMMRLTDPDFVCYSRKEDFFGYRQEIKTIKASSSPRYIDSEFFEDEEFRYIYRITPSFCRKDVQDWLKSCRHFAERKLGVHYDFGYAICSEMGPRTCRPHYHCCFFGLPIEVVRQFSELWKYGFVDVKPVERVNPDKSDGFSRVADYIGKYVSKGVFECDSVKCGAACKNRMMTSKSLGSSLVEKFTDYVCAFDIVGAKYDIDTFWIPSRNRYLTRSELVTLCFEVPKRLSISFDGKRYFAFPRVLRNKIFYVKKIGKDGVTAYDRPSRLWKMVVDAISRQYAELRRQEFEQFLSRFSPGKICEAVSAFNHLQESVAEMADSSRKQNYQTKLTKSIF